MHRDSRRLIHDIAVMWSPASATDHRLRPPRLRPPHRRRDPRPPVTRAACGPGAPQPAAGAATRRHRHTDPTACAPHPLLSDAEGGVFRCWVPTSRRRARLTLRSPPTRTRRALFGRHAAADDRPPENHIEPRRLRPALPVRLDTSFCTNDTANVLNCTATPHCVSSLPFKNPFLQKFARRALLEEEDAPLAARAAAPCATSSWWLRAACAWSRTPRRVCMAGRRS